MELKMILKDGNEITLSELTLPLHAVVVCETRDAVNAVWDKLTPQALEEVTITEDGETVATYENCWQTGNQCILNPDDTITAHFYLDGTRKHVEPAAPVDPEEATAEDYEAALTELGVTVE